MGHRIAGIDVHKRCLMVVVVDEAAAVQGKRKFGTTSGEMSHLHAWLKEQMVAEVVMESTAQYWKPVWFAMERLFPLHLAQAWSNRAPHGKKTDFKDAERLARRHMAGELTLSFIPGEEQRQMRTVTRRRTQLTRERVRIQNQVESLLEETRIKLSSVISDLFGASGVRILVALAKGESDPAELAKLADPRVQCEPAALLDALSGQVSAIQRKVLDQHLKQLELVDEQIEELTTLMADATRAHSATIARLAEVPGIRTLAAQLIIAEAGPEAKTFDTARKFSSWIGLCPGREESAETNYSSRCAKGNAYLRRVLCQAAQAAVRTKNSYFQQKFNRLIVKLGYVKAIWAIARHMSVVVWKILHDGADYIEFGGQTSKQAKKRREQRLRKEMRALGYDDTLIPARRPSPVQ